MPDSAPLPTAKPSSNVSELQVTTGAFASSRKVYATSKRYGDLRIAMREIDLEESAKEPAVRVYDTSGPYSDTAVETDIARGLAELRSGREQRHAILGHHTGVLGVRSVGVGVAAQHQTLQAGNSQRIPHALRIETQRPIKHAVFERQSRLKRLQRPRLHLGVVRRHLQNRARW